MASNTPFTYLPLMLLEPVNSHLLPHFIPNPKCYPANLPILIDKPTYYLNLNFFIIYFTPKVKFITSSPLAVAVAIFMLELIVSIL